ncbi:MAG: outer membrane beta-barrel protein [Proteobacteria bacterium]|nr:outer membrane beta-barrel protein [Pseudomonadota bacterium]
MKKFLLAGVAVAALASGAQAADLGAPRGPVAAVVVAPQFNWTGFYLGVFVGGTSTRTSALEVQGASPGAYNGLGDFWSGSRTGVTAGILGGYNWQWNSAVFGIEADLGYRGSAFTAGPSALSTDTFLRTRDGLQGSLRARLGFAADRALFYVTGGLAIGDFRSNVFDNVGVTINTNAVGTRVGWTVGGGIEYAFTSNWTARVEYLYANFGTATSTGISSVATNRAWQIKNDTHTVRLGVNYLFSTGPSAVVARY